MSFKGKVDFNAFDLNNSKVKNLEEAAVRGLSKNAVKKLLNAPGTRTPYFLILDYFKNKDGKPVAHFLTFGTNKKMEKHFEQVEMKSGKLDKSMSASQKEASMGEAYSKEDKGKKLLCFEPSDKCKIPKSQWPKILKALKPFLAGAKPVVVLNGTVVGEDSDGSEEDTTGGTSSTDTTGEDNTTTRSVDNVEEDNTTATQDVAGLAQQFKAQIGEIVGFLKGQLPKEILPKIKDKTASEEDLTSVQDFQAKMDSFKEEFDNAPEKLKNALAGAVNKILGQAPKIAQIIAALEKLVGAVTRETSDEESVDEDTSALEELLQTVTNNIGDFDGKIGSLTEELETATSEPLPTGQELLDQVG
jgi:hypothetical protein